MEIEMELTALRREVAELRAGLQSMETHHKEKSGEEYWDTMINQLQEEMKQSGQTSAVGVMRAVVYLRGDPDDLKNVATYGSENHFGTPDKLPSEERLIALCAALNNPVGLRALYTVFKRIYAGHWLSMDKPELAAALGIGEPELEQALHPLIDNGMLRWGKSAAGEYFELDRPDLFAMLLTFA